MKKKHLKIVLPVLFVLIVLGIYPYTQPHISVKQVEVEENIPVKVSLWRDSVAYAGAACVFIPFKFEVSNNRYSTVEFHDIKIEKYWLDRPHYRLSYRGWYEDFYISSNRALVFAEDGNPIPDPRQKNSYHDELLYQDKYLEYTKWRYIKRKNELWKPFTKRTLYFYYPLIISLEALRKQNKDLDLKALIRDFNKKQARHRDTKSTYTFDKKLIKGLYKKATDKKIRFKFNKSHKSSYGSYYVLYKLNTTRQKYVNGYIGVNQIETVKDMDKYIKNLDEQTSFEVEF